MSSGAITGVITKAQIPTKIFYYVDGTPPEANEIDVKGVLPDSLGEDHVDKYYYKDKKLYLVIKNDNETYEAKEIANVENPLPDPLGENHVGNYYYGHEEAFLGVSSFSRIWGEVEDSEGNSTTLNLQDAMNALFKMMVSQSHVWVGSENDVPDYAKLLIETDKQ